VHFCNPYRCRFVTAIAATAMIFFLSATSSAEEKGTPGTEKSAREISEVPSPTPLEPPATGSSYRIDATSYAYYEKPKMYSFLVNTPLTIYDWLKDSFQQKNALTIAGLAVVTGGLIAIDQDLYRGAQDVGRNLGISGDSVMGRVFPGSPIQYPTDLGTALYYIGDGMIPISITVGMLGYGLVTSDVRSLQTSSQLAEGLLSVAVVVQTIKRTTGRQSPGTSTESGGKWQFFPNVKEYNRNTPAFDAFPSGHLATGMMTITVLAENYPEYSLIRPIGYGLMTLLGFQMMNNGVHWASDYPLAIAIGYGLGKVAVSHGRKVVTTGDSPEKTSKRSFITDMALLPLPLENGGALVAIGKF
jgi:hypothetical protein